MESKTGIYTILSPSGKIYIGQTWDFVDRLRRYRNLSCRAQRKLFASFKKYGFETHVPLLIHTFDEPTQEHLDYAECFYMALYRLCGFELLNLREGGGSKGKNSPETNIRISEANKGRMPPPKTPEAIERQRQRMTGIKNPFYGRRHSPEMKKLIGEKGIGRSKSSDTLERMRLSMLGKNAGKGGILKSEDIPQIHLLISGGKNDKEIGIRFGVHQKTISDIRMNKTWKHICRQN